MSDSVKTAIQSLEKASSIVHRIRCCNSVVARFKTKIKDITSQNKLPYEKHLLLPTQNDFRRRSTDSLFAPERALPVGLVADTTANANPSGDDDWEQQCSQNIDASVAVNAALLYWAHVDEIESYKSSLESMYEDLLKCFREFRTAPSSILALLKQASSHHYDTLSEFDAKLITVRDHLRKAVETAAKKAESVAGHLQVTAKEMEERIRTKEEVDASITQATRKLSVLRDQLERHERAIEAFKRTRASLSAVHNNVSANLRDATAAAETHCGLIQSFHRDYETLARLADLYSRSEKVVSSLASSSSATGDSTMPATPSDFYLDPQLNPLYDFPNDFTLESAFGTAFTDTWQLPEPVSAPVSVSSSFSHAASRLTLNDDAAALDTGGFAPDLPASFADHEEEEERQQHLRMEDSGVDLRSSAGIDPRNVTHDTQEPDYILATQDQLVLSDQPDLMETVEQETDDQLDASLPPAKRQKTRETDTTADLVIVEPDLQQQQQRVEIEDEEEAETELAPPMEPVTSSRNLGNIFCRLWSRRPQEVPLKAVPSIRSFWLVKQNPSFPTRDVLQILLLSRTTLTTRRIDIDIPYKGTRTIEERLEEIDLEQASDPDVGLVYVLLQSTDRSGLQTTYQLGETPLLWRVHWSFLQEDPECTKLQTAFMQQSVHRRFQIAQKFEPDPLFLLTVQGLPAEDLVLLMRQEGKAHKYAGPIACGFNGSFFFDDKKRAMRRAHWNMYLFWKPTSADQPVMTTRLFWMKDPETNEKKFSFEITKPPDGMFLHFFIKLMSRVEITGANLSTFIHLTTDYANLALCNNYSYEQRMLHLATPAKSALTTGLFMRGLETTGDILLSAYERVTSRYDPLVHGVIYADPIELGLATSAQLHVCSFAIRGTVRRNKPVARGDDLLDYQLAAAWFVCQSDISQWSTFTWMHVGVVFPDLLQVKTRFGSTKEVVYPAQLTSDMFEAQKVSCRISSLFRSAWMTDEQAIMLADASELVQKSEWFFVMEPWFNDTNVPGQDPYDTVMTRDDFTSTDLSYRYGDVLKQHREQPGAVNPVAEGFFRHRLFYVHVHLVNPIYVHGTAAVYFTLDTREYSGEQRAYMQLLFPDHGVQALGWSGSALLEMMEIFMEECSRAATVQVVLQDGSYFTSEDPRTGKAQLRSSFLHYMWQNATRSRVSTNGMDMFFYGRRGYAPVTLESCLLLVPENPHAAKIAEILQIYHTLLGTTTATDILQLVTLHLTTKTAGHVKEGAQYIRKATEDCIYEQSGEINALSVLLGLSLTDSRFYDECFNGLLGGKVHLQSPFLQFCQTLNTYVDKTAREKKWRWRKTLTKTV